MKNVLVGIDKSGSFRVYLTITTKMVEEVRKIHNLSPVAVAALGRTMTGAGLMGIQLKGEDDKLTVLFKGDGPLKQILATAKRNGDVKGYVYNPDCDLPLNKFGKLDVGGAIGVGELTVIKDLGLKEPYVGTIALVDGEIADDLTAYYYISEQQNTAISLGVKVDRDYSVYCAGGMFIQMLPNAREDSIDELEKMLSNLPPITTLISDVMEDKLLSMEGMLEKLKDKIFGNMLEDFKVDTLAYENIDFKCDCSKERLEKVLISIGEKDLREITEEDKKAELTCQFCLKKYHFNEDELKALLERI